MAAEYSCASCKTPFINRFPLDDQGLCGLCRRGFTPFDAAYSFGSYEDELRKLIHLFKYGRIETLAGPLGRFMITALPRELNFDVIVPMPLHWTKLWRRGFNQSELLAAAVSRRWNVPLKRLVRRIRATPVQAGLTSAKRRVNVSGAFRAKSGVAGLKVLLVDDVLTTGATAGACASALKRAGAARVTLLTLARADRRFSVPVLRDTASIPDSTTFGSLNDAKPGSIA
ncbi:MAG: ComF family protein [Bryobacteraceae bacterium]|jgi:ComF family protein